MSYFKYKHYSCYYEEYGSGNPTVFLHGNTASSKMFELLLPLYQNRIKVIEFKDSAWTQDQQSGNWILEFDNNTTGYTDDKFVALLDFLNNDGSYTRSSNEFEITKDGGIKMTNDNGGYDGRFVLMSDATLLTDNCVKEVVVNGDKLQVFFIDGKTHEYDIVPVDDDN